MTTTYITGTRYPSPTLKQFLPDYLDTLAGEGTALLTTNKSGVDERVIQHCDDHAIPLRVIEFVCDSGNSYRNRRVSADSDRIQIQRIVSPTWLRFRHLVDQVDQIIFFHAAKTRGRCEGLSTRQAFEQACHRRGIQGEQFIIQRQHAMWVNQTDLRQAPIIGAVHIYLYSRTLKGLAGERHSLGYFRIETWRQIGGIVQPGEGRREIILPSVTRKHEANGLMLRQALRQLAPQPVQHLIIHHHCPSLERSITQPPASRRYATIDRQVRDLLQSYPRVVWRYEPRTDLLQQIGQPIKSDQALWDHKRSRQAYQGLYQ